MHVFLEGRWPTRPLSFLSEAYRLGLGALWVTLWALKMTQWPCAVAAGAHVENSYLSGLGNYKSEAGKPWMLKGVENFRRWRVTESIYKLSLPTSLTYPWMIYVQNRLSSSDLKKIIEMRMELLPNSVGSSRPAQTSPAETKETTFTGEKNKNKNKHSIWILHKLTFIMYNPKVINIQSIKKMEHILTRKQNLQRLTSRSTRCWS